MSWYGWALVALFAWSTLLNVAKVGEPRKPTTPEVAAICVALNALVIWGVLTLGGAV